MGQGLSVAALQEHVATDFKGCFYHAAFSGCTPSGCYATCAVCDITTQTLLYFLQYCYSIIISFLFLYHQASNPLVSPHHQNGVLCIFSSFLLCLFTHILSVITINTKRISYINQYLNFLQ